MTEQVTEAERIAAGRQAYLDAVAKEIEVCPHCETWLLSECNAGLGCPTPDGRNGESVRAIPQENPNG